MKPINILLASVVLCGMAGCVETTTITASTPQPNVTAKAGGGADVRFPSGCWISYDAAASRGGHVGACTDAEFARADRDAAGFLSGTQQTTAVASNDLSAFQGARAGQAEGGLRARGYELSRTEGLTAYWYNRGAGSCARIVTSGGRYASVTMVPAGNC